MDVKMEATGRNDTWELVELSEGSKRVEVKWVYKAKFNENWELTKYKAKLVVKGYAQEHGKDYTEVFALVAYMETIRLVIELAVKK